MQVTPTLNFITHDSFVAEIKTIAAAVSDSGWQVDYLIGVGRGGLVPATYLSHALDRPLLSVDHSANVYCFGDQLLAEVAAKSARGLKLLIVDDINDSGRTIATLREAIEGAGGEPDNVRVAVLIHNVRSIEAVDFSARAIDREVTKDWFVFPWEALGQRDTLLRDAAEVPARIA